MYKSQISFNHKFLKKTHLLSFYYFKLHSFIPFLYPDPMATVLSKEPKMGIGKILFLPTSPIKLVKKENKSALIVS